MLFLRQITSNNILKLKFISRFDGFSINKSLNHQWDSNYQEMDGTCQATKQFQRVSLIVL